MRNSNVKFPAQLLSSSKEDRVQYFRNKIISHPKLDEAYQEMVKITNLKSTPLVMIYGPSGVGKSTLLNKLKNEIIKRLLSELETDKGRIPVILFEAKAAESIKFNWSDFFRAGLFELQEPCINKKVVPVHPKFAGASLTASSSGLRWAYESAIIHRRPVACIIDEAQHIAKKSKGASLQNQLDVIKSLANITGVPHIMAGTYELLQFRDQSAQLSNRSIDIHLSRYRAENPKELYQFKTILLTFQDHLPVQNVDLISHWRFLYERSIGCIGVLKLWLERALDYCLSENSTSMTLTKEHIEQTAKSIKQCTKMINDARNGELAILETEEEREHLITFLGLDKVLTINEEKKVPGKKVNKPGIRNPKRDQVGSRISSSDS